MNRFFELALTNAALACVLGTLAWVATRVVRRPAVSHALWLLVIMKLVTPPFVSWPVLPVDSRKELRTLVSPSAVPMPARDSAANEVNPYLAGLAVDGVAPSDAGLNDDSPRLGAPIELPLRNPVASSRRLSLRDFAFAFYATWALGTLAVLSISLVRLGQLVRLLLRAPAADETLRTNVALLAAEMGLRRSPRVCAVPGRFTPFVWAIGGWSVLVVPVDLWQRLDFEQRGALLLHELAHLRRRDPWVRWAELVATCLYWWHPALWIARRGLHQSEEQCCDAWVVWARPAAAKSYASALVAALEFLSESRPRPRLVPIGASGLGRLHFISRRITMIMNGNVPRRLSWPGVALMCALGAVALPCMPTPARSQDKPATPGGAMVDFDDDGKLDLYIAAVDPTQKPAAAQDAAPSLDDLQDAVELAQAQVQIKEANLKKAQSQRDAAHLGLARASRLKEQNVVSIEEVQQATGAAQTADAGVAIAEAELKETMVRLNQAKRRLDRAGAGARQGATSGHKPGGRAERSARGFLLGEPTRPASEPSNPERDRRETMNNLKQIGLALHNYADVNGHLPPAAICGKDGTPLLSWRVAILPYLDQEALYREFHLDEPWNGEHNRTLIQKLPRVFGRGNGLTLIRALQFPGGVFDPNKSEGIAFREITDGTSNTIAAFESGEATVWTSPEPINSRAQMPDMFLALFCDGSVRTLLTKYDRGALQALFTINGGEVADPSEFAPSKPANTDEAAKRDAARTLFDAANRAIRSDAISKQAEVQEAIEQLKQAAPDQIERMRGLIEGPNGKELLRRRMEATEARRVEELAEATERIRELESVIAGLRNELQELRAMNGRAAKKAEETAGAK